MKSDTQKLWRIKLNGPTWRYSPCYVVAFDATSAYEAVLRELKRLHYKEKDTELVSVELIAEDDTLSSCCLFLTNR